MPDSSATPAMPEILTRVLERRRLRVAAAQAKVDEGQLRRQAERAPRRDFAAALRNAASRPAVIAELKQASPSRGRLRSDFPVEDLAAGYAAAGAAALSVLTEEDFFLGCLEDLVRARAASGLPVLRKDFIYCGYQVWEAAAAGADAVLLIAAMLDDATMAALLKLAGEVGMAALCEVHDAAELARVKALGASIIGVNNRDLRTFQVHTGRAAELAPALPPEVLGVAESGLRHAGDLVRMAAAGYRAVLIGEHFMQAADPGQALAAMLAGLQFQAAPQ